MRKYIIRFIIFYSIVLIVGNVFLRYASADDDFHLVDLNELSIDYKNFNMVNPDSHNMLIWPNTPKEGINVGIKLDLLHYFYWDSVIESLTDDAQYASIGLDTRLGLRVSQYLEVGFYHHSQHVLDRAYTGMDGHFPEEDAVEVKIYLYRGSPRPSVLK